MVATTLKQREIALIGYNTDDPMGIPSDTISFVLLAPIGSGTQIFFTDRLWNGTTFAAAGGGDGTFTFTAGADMVAGTIVTITQAQLSAAGINLSDAGETIYVYQGAINTPTTFLYAADIADANTTFNGSLVNTGLSVANGTATAIAGDNGTFGDRGHNIQTGDLLTSISSATNWTSNDDSPQNPITGNLLSAPDQYVFTVIAGDAGLLRMSRDGANVATQALHHFQTNPSPATQFNHPNDIVFDTVHGLFFIADSDTGNRRILQGNIADLFNPGVLPTLTVLYTDQTPGTGNGQINGLAIDIDHATGQGALYFVNQDDLLRVTYDHDGTSPTNQTPVNLASVPAGEFANELTLDIATGRAWIVSTASATTPITVPAGTPGAIFDPDSGTWYIVATDITNNAIYQVSNLARGDTNNSGNTVVALDINGATAGTDLVDEQGLLSSVDVDPVTGHVYFTTIQINNGINGAVGGIYRLNLGTGVVEILYTEGNATDYLFKYIDVDPETGRYYVTNNSFESPGDINGTANNTSSVMFHATSVGTPTVFHANAGNINSGVPWGLIVDNAPTLTGTNLNPGQTETAGNPSPNPAAVTPANAFTAMDIDTDLQVDQLGGAQVRISAGFQTGAGHQDVLTIGGLTSGTFSAGAAGAAQDIAFSYNSTTGVMTLTGASTFAGYQAALAAVQFQANGDNPTNFGANGTRTISYSVTDGLMYSDEVHATVTVTGVNDAPVNTNAGADSGAEDTTINIAGLSIVDVDADPAAAGGQQLTVTLTVARGTLTLNTGVAGGIVPGDIIGGAQGTATITIQASAAEINATFANATGVQYTGGTNVNGTIQLTMVTDDGGFNGNDPGLTGTGTSEADTDIYTITVTAVNDAPTVGDGTEDAPAILEDTPHTNLTAPTVATLFGGQFSDAADDQTAFPGGSSPNTFAGIAVITNGSSGATGQWQYWTGAAWVNIGSPGAGSATFVRGDALIRFEPALNFNGNAPTLVAHLVDNSAGSPTVNGAGINLIVTPPGGTSPYSSGTVTLSQAITPVNDAPTQAGLHGDTATWTEGGAATLLDLGSNMTLADIDSADFDGGTLTVLLSGGVVAQDGIFIETVGGVTSTANTVSVGATQIATYTGGGFGGGNIVFTFNADATPAAVQALMRALSYNNNGGDNPTAGTRSVTWTLVDGDGTLNGGADTLLIGSFVDVVAVNDAPEGNDNTLFLAEDGTLVLTQGNFGFSDPSDGNAFAGVVITTLPTNGTLLLNGTPITVAGTFVTATQINSSQLVFQPDLNENGTPYGSFTFQVRDNGGILNGGQDTDQSANTMTFDVNPINDAPLNTVPGAQSVNEEGTLTFNAANGNLISIADVDAGAADLTTTVSIADGALNVGATMAGLAVTGAGTNTLILVGTLAEINDALDGLTYTPPANANGPRTLTVSTNDGGATGADPGLSGDGDDEADSDPITITINSVNDEPAGSNGTVTANEDDPYVFTAADFGFTDPLDSNLFAGVVLTSLPIEGDLRLNGVNITLAGTFITAADIASGLLTFLADPDEYGTAYASFDFQVRDDGGILNGGQNTDQSANTMTINVTADNFVPVVDLNSGTPGVNDTNLYVENGAASGLGTAITVTDTEGDMITGAVITITDPSAGDLLSANLPLPGGITIHASSTATMLVLTGTASAANYATALGQLGYSNTGEDPTAGGNTDRVITVTVSDATGTSAPATMTMAVSPINDEPTLTATGATQTLPEGGSVDLFSVVAASTVEAGQNFTSMTVTVTNVSGDPSEGLGIDGTGISAVDGNSDVTATNGLTVTVSVLAGTATFSFSSASLSAAQLQTLVDGLNYFNFSENPTDADRVVTITQVTDSGSNTPPNDNTTTLAIVSTVNVDPVNDPPINTVPGTQAINEDGSVTLSAGNGNAIQVADADAATLTVTLTVANGTLTLASTASLSFGAGDGTADVTMTFSGTAAAINAALGSGLTYNPNAHFNGSDAIAVFTTDNGQSGGPAQTDSDSVTINITAISDAPAGADKTVTGSEDDPYVFTAADFGFTDPADSNAFFAVRIMTFPANGTLFLDSDGPGGAAPVDLSTVGPGVYVSITDINAGELYFQPDPDEFGNGYATFTFAVQDDGGTINGGQDTDQSPNTMTINIAQDNVPPAVDLDGGTGGVNYTASYTEDALGVAIGSGVTVTDPNSGTGDMIESATITLTDRVAGDSLTITGALPPGIIAVTTPTAGAITIQITGTGTGAQYQALIESIQYATTSQDPTVGGTDLARTITVTVNDGTIDSAVATTTVNITATDDAPVAQPDAYTITEAGSIVGGNVFANNGSGLDNDPDGPPLSVSAVSGGTIGVQFTLPSGALLTMNANGTFNYNPNGAFDFTPTLGSGAVNTPSVDQFTYTLTGGGTATVTVTLTGLDTNDTLIGSAAADMLNAGVGNDYIDGLAGADSMVGASGNDTYIVDDAGDVVIEAGGEGSDVVYARTSYALGGGSHVETLAAIDNAATTAMALVGNEFANNIQGNQGANFIDGNGGADIMAGFSGDDVYVVDNAGDLVIEGVGRGNDIVYARISYTLMAGAEVETLAAIDNSLTDPLVLIGNEFANTIYGNEGANYIDGAAGADAMVGFGGDDVYIVDNAGDAVFEDAGDGSDTVYARASYALTAGSEVEILAAIDNAALTAINLTGNALANIILGNSGANVINGGGGSDILAGFGGADTYQFTSALGGGNVAYIFEFSGIASDGDDVIALDDAVFTGLALGALDPGAIVAGPAAQDADDRIIYDSSTGSLYFDADGNGAGAMVLFAVLLDSPALSAGDFTVI